MSFENCKFTLDWLQGVLPFDDVRVLFKALGEIDNRLCPENWTPFGSFRNYRTRFICQGRASVSIAYNDDMLQDPYNDSLWYKQPNNNENISLIAENHPYNPGIFVSISGDGLRWLNENPNTVKKIMEYFRFQKFNCSRLDVACDIFDSKNNLIPTIIKAFKNAVSMSPGKFGLRSNIRRTSGKNGSVKLYPYTDTIREENNNKTIWNCSLGDHGSSFGMFRCYDKWFEIASGRLSEYKTQMLDTLPEKYWYRLEYELHNGTSVKYAATVFNALADETMNIKEAFGFAAENMFDIVKVKTAFENVSSREIPKIWVSFLQFIHFVELNLDLITTPWVEKTPEKLKYWARNICKAIYKIEKLFEKDPTFKDEILSNGQRKFDNDIIGKTQFDNWLAMLC